MTQGGKRWVPGAGAEHGVISSRRPRALALASYWCEVHTTTNSSSVMVSRVQYLGSKFQADCVSLATTRPPDRCPRAPDARRAQEWRNTERAPDQLRYLDEPYAERGGTNKSRWRQVLQATRGLRTRK